ncbi:hypothetical protein GIB67_037128, partial [Kingdonia uniflora]
MLVKMLKPTKRRKRKSEFLTGIDKLGSVAILTSFPVSPFYLLLFLAKDIFSSHTAIFFYCVILFTFVLILSFCWVRDVFQYSYIHLLLLRYTVYIDSISGGITYLAIYKLCQRCL